MKSFALSLLVAVLTATFAPPALAQTLEAPVGGKAIPLPRGTVACGAAAGGWKVEADRSSVTPPPTSDQIGQRTSLGVAPSDSGCATSKASVTLVATGAWPTFDPQSLVLFSDERRVEARGKKLRGARLFAEGEHVAHDEVCDAPLADGAEERCSWPAGIGLPSLPGGTAFLWAPSGSVSTGDEIYYDADGAVVPADRLRLSASRVVLSSLVAPGASIDALGLSASVPLVHADAVSAVDCGTTLCALEGKNIVVGSLPVGISALVARVRLAPHVAFRRGDALDNDPVFKIPVARCPLSVVSGEPLRDVDNQKIVVRIEGRCAADSDHLRFQLSGYQAERIRDVRTSGATYVVLRLPQIDSDEISLFATRDEGEAFVVAQARVRTRAVPSVRVALELPNHVPIDFLPTNVDAVAHASSGAWDGELSIVPIEGLYTARTDHQQTHVRGVSEAVGFVSLRVALRLGTLPPPLSDMDLLVVSDGSQRAVREASLPAPLDGADPSQRLVDLLCDSGDGRTLVVPEGATTHIPFDERDSCRLVLHAERLDSTFGTQKLVLDVDVTRVDGSPRVEARISRTLTFAAGSKPRVLWLHGAENRFDRFSIRVSHAADERHYVTTDDSEIGLPAEQWTVVTGKGFARVYATSAIPTGLYRVSDRAHSGLLTLNFGVVARLTWLDSLGHEGLLAAEAGVMGVGLANDVSASGRSLTQVATVTGLGFSVPIANRALATETAINLHAWYEWEPSRALGGASGSSSAFVFGPSISVGNVGADL